MNPKGSLPLLILHTLAQGPSHGYQIAREIEQKSQGVLDFKEGTLYPTLHGLEKEGLIEAYEAEANGRIRRTYRLTESGQERLTRERARWERYVSAVSLVLEGEKA